MELRDAFRLFDKDGDGCISSEYLVSAMRGLGHVLTTDDLKYMNVTVSGTLTFEDFVVVMSSLEENSVINEDDEDKELERAFGVFDKSSSGFITLSDLRSILQVVGEDPTDNEIKDMISMVDMNGDGRIDYREFVACLKVEVKVEEEITVKEETSHDDSS